MFFVKCPNCGKCHHETTDKFDPNVRPNGSMVRLLDPWRKWGWTPFGGQDGRDIAYAESAATLASDMFCPGCGSPLAPGGRLTVIDEGLKPADAAEEKVEQSEGDEQGKGENDQKELIASMVKEGKTRKEMMTATGLNFTSLSAKIKEVNKNG